MGSLATDGAHVVVAGNSQPRRSRAASWPAVRDTDAVRSGVSSVDDANTSFGQVSSALALANAVTGETGHYGTQDGADALFPTPAN